MAITPQLLSALLQNAPRNALRDAAMARLETLGWPKGRSEAWTYFPLSAFQGVDLPELPSRSDSANGTLLELIASETDQAALLPIILGGATRSYNLASEGPSDEELALAQVEACAHAVVEVEAGSKLKLLMPRPAASMPFRSQRMDFVVGEGAEVDLVLLGEASADAKLVLRHARIHQKAGSVVRILTMHSGQGTYRGSLDIHLQGEEARCEYRALVLASGKGQSHRRVRISHEAPRCESTQWVRHVLADEAHASFDGSVDVGRDCSGTQSHQLVNSLLLSDHAKASTKPNLRIFHDDVECTHGNTCSDLDSEALFYLQSRSVPYSEARRMLTAAFVEEVVRAHPQSPARDLLLARARQDLSKMVGA